MANPKYVTMDGTVKTVTLDADYQIVQVTYIDGTGSKPVYFTTDGSTPAAAADGTRAIPGTLGSSQTVAVAGSGNSVVKLLQPSGAAVVLVEGLER